MRYFKLINSNGVTLDITTQSILFYSIEGLGFEEDAVFRRVSETWWLSSASYKQAAIKGKICFTGLEGEDPYGLYFKFSKFVSRAPLTLVYYPYGLDGDAYYRTVRVTELTKSELTKYGVLDESIKFQAYTPWYELVSATNAESTVITELGWVWGGDTYPPLTFEPSNPDGNKTKFGSERKSFVNVFSPINSKGPMKITIYGPVRNPVWLHYIGNTRIGSGRFDSSENVEIPEGARLEIDNTNGRHRMEILSAAGAVLKNVYSLRDFDTLGFFNLREGYNTISVTSSETDFVRFDVEGHVYYATV